MSFIASSVSTALLVGAGVAAVGGVAYGVISANKAANAARGAVVQQQKDDAAAQAKSEADAANEANARRVAQKRAYQANALALGGNGDDSLGAPGAPRSVLAAGASGGSVSSRGSASGAGGATSVLGAGAPMAGGSMAGGTGAGGGRYRYSRSAA
jgi:hypothetical protein